MIKGTDYATVRMVGVVCSYPRYHAAHGGYQWWFLIPGIGQGRINTVSVEIAGQPDMDRQVESIKPGSVLKINGALRCHQARFKGIGDKYWERSVLAESIAVLGFKEDVKSFHNGLLTDAGEFEEKYLFPFPLGSEDVNSVQLRGRLMMGSGYFDFPDGTAGLNIPVAVCRAGGREKISCTVTDQRLLLQLPVLRCGSRITISGSPQSYTRVFWLETGRREMVTMHSVFASSVIVEKA